MESGINTEAAAAGRYCTVDGWAGQDCHLVQASATAAVQQVPLLVVAEAWRAG